LDKSFIVHLSCKKVSSIILEKLELLFDVPGIAVTAYVVVCVTDVVGVVGVVTVVSATQHEYMTTEHGREPGIAEQIGFVGLLTQKPSFLLGC
jgi:hypothetical protein